MPPFPGLVPQKSRLSVLLGHFAAVEDPRDVRRIDHPLAEILLLVVCGTMADCNDYDHIAHGAAHVDFLRRHLPHEHGTPGGRWLTILMNRINPALFSAAFATTSRLVLCPEVVTDILFLAVREGACAFWEVPKHLFPAPSDIAAAFGADRPVLLHGLWSTLRVTLLAFAASVVLGTLVARGAPGHRQHG